MARTFKDSKGREWRPQINLEVLLKYKAATGHSALEMVKTPPNTPRASLGLKDGQRPPEKILRVWADLIAGNPQSTIKLGVLACAAAREEAGVAETDFLSAITNMEQVAAVVAATAEAVLEFVTGSPS